MRPENVLLTWAQKLIYGWLIFCVGGLAPLTFSTPLSPHRDVPVVNIAFFESPGHISLTPANSDPLTALVQRIWKTQNFNPHVKTHALESFTPSLVQFFQSNLSSGYLLGVARTCLVLQTALFCLIALDVFAGRSALLPPFEKPPQTLFA
ncbi:MAG: hypothetical protein HC875_07550 [Anaerolineales bacterium]|nr:hypothetical protein [Anaerolineales bacterium]